MTDRLTPQSKSLICFHLWDVSFISERGRGASGESVMQDKCPDGGDGTDSQVVMFTLLPQLVDSVTLKRRSRTCCLWRMCFILSVTQSRSSLCHIVTSSEEEDPMSSSRSLTSHTLRRWILSFLVYSHNESFKQDVKDGYKQQQVASSTA